MRTTPVITLALLTSLGFGLAASSATAAVPVIEPTAEELAVQAIFDDTNTLRVDNDLEPLVVSTVLSTIADDWAQQLEVGFQHNPDLFDVIPSGWARAGENIAYATYGDGHLMVELWADSPGHRKNILNTAYNYIGIGWYHSETGTRYAVQVFAAYSSSPDPIVEPVVEPVGEPVGEPTGEPVVEPTGEPVTAPPAVAPTIPVTPRVVQPTSSPVGERSTPSAPDTTTGSETNEPGEMIEPVEVEASTEPDTSAEAETDAPAEAGAGVGTAVEAAAEPVTPGPPVFAAALIVFGGLLASGMVLVAAVPSWRTRFLGALGMK